MLTPTPTQLNTLVNQLYQARQLRLTNPEGHPDKEGLWQPSEAEDAGGEARKVSPPSKTMRYSYQVHCRSKAHVRILLGRAMQGLDVPGDIARGWGALVRSLQTRVTTSKPKVATGAANDVVPPKLEHLLTEVPTAQLTDLILEFGMFLERRDARS